MKKRKISLICTSLLIVLNIGISPVFAGVSSGEMPLSAINMTNGQWKTTSSKQNTYCDNEGNLVKGKFIKNNNKVYCLDEDGFLCIGTIYTKNEGYIYATDKNGALYQNSWGLVNNTWMYFGNDYKCIKSNWISDNGNKYYLKEDGAMAKGWKQIGGQWYYFNNSGAMLKNTTIGSYRLGKDGVWEK